MRVGKYLRLMIVHHHGIERASRDTQQAAPAAAHIQERAVIAVNAPECIPAANSACLTKVTRLTQVIVHL